MKTYILELLAGITGWQLGWIMSCDLPDGLGVWIDVIQPLWGVAVTGGMIERVTILIRSCETLGSVFFLSATWVTPASGWLGGPAVETWSAVLAMRVGTPRCSSAVRLGVCSCSARPGSLASLSSCALNPHCSLQVKMPGTESTPHTPAPNTCLFLCPGNVT